MVQSLEIKKHKAVPALQDTALSLIEAGDQNSYCAMMRTVRPPWTLNGRR